MGSTNALFALPKANKLEPRHIFTLPIFPLDHPAPLALVDVICASGGTKATADTKAVFDALVQEEKIEVSNEDGVFICRDHVNDNCDEKLIVLGHQKLLEAYKSGVKKGKDAVSRTTTRSGSTSEEKVDGIVSSLLQAATKHTGPADYFDIEDDGYFYQHVMFHLLSADLYDEIARLLTTGAWLVRLLDAVGVAGLSRMYSIMMSPARLQCLNREDAASVSLLTEVLRLNLIREDGSDFIDQLLGRTVGVLALPPIKRLFTEVVTLRDRVQNIWLCPITAALRTPGESLRIEQNNCAIYAVQISADGQRVVVGTFEGKVVVWNISKEPVEEISFSHKERVNALAMTPEGDRIVSGSDDKLVCLWDVPSGERLRKLKGHKAPVLAVALTSDSTIAASGCQEGVVRIWNLNTSECKFTLSQHTDKVHSISLDAAATRCYSASQDRSVIIWDLENGASLHCITAHGDASTCVAVTPDNRRLFTGGADRLVSVWDLTLDPPKLLHSFEGHTGMVKSVACSDDGDRVVSVARDRTVRLWSVSAKALLLQHSEHTKAVSSVHMTKDGSRLVSGGQDKLVNITLVSDAVRLGKYAGKTHVGMVSALASPDDGRIVASASHDGTLCVINGTNGIRLASCEGHGDIVFCVAVSANGDYLFSGSRDKTIRAWNPVNGKELSQLLGHENSVMCLASNKDGKILVSGGADQLVCIWERTAVNPEPKYSVRTLQGHGGNVMSIALSSDARLVVSGSSDSTVRLWNVSSGSQLCSMDDHGRAVSALCLDFAHHLLMSGGSDGVVRVWDIKGVLETNTIHCQRTIEGHTDSVTGISLSTNRKMVFTSCDDKKLRVWSAETGDLICDYECDEETTAVVSHNDIIAVGTQGGRVALFNLHRLNNNTPASKDKEKDSGSPKHPRTASSSGGDGAAEAKGSGSVNTNATVSNSKSAKEGKDKKGCVMM